jgi:hypothetical protein
MKVLALFGAAFAGAIALFCTAGLAAMCVLDAANELGIFLYLGLPLWWVAYRLYSLRNDV